MFTQAVARLLGELIGGALITRALTLLVRWWLKSIDAQVAAMVAFLAVSGLAILLYVGLVGHPFASFVRVYLPWLILWLLVDLYRGRKGGQNKT